METMPFFTSTVTGVTKNCFLLGKKYNFTTDSAIFFCSAVVYEQTLYLNGPCHFYEAILTKGSLFGSSSTISQCLTSGQHITKKGKYTIYKFFQEDGDTMKR